MTLQTSSKYSLWRCDDGTFDIVEEGRIDDFDHHGVVWTNLPEEVARMVVLHDELVAALREMMAYAAQEIGLPVDECVGGAFAKARAALAKVENEHA